MFFNLSLTGEIKELTLFVAIVNFWDFFPSGVENKLPTSELLFVCVEPLHFLGQRYHNSADYHRCYRLLCCFPQ
ncbi:uncharacterized protein LOC119647614 isoform X2 [Hermetia illucens]|uniref:uncharacterized protein LOC119647614 isoform X2 n=1 Tax=Hermetia illucens TaxID=343691 RepID=UPI0018CC176E|nr:uncharacterized protein LOC119647614 isoform X2 [Hermetia illucens]